MVSGRKQRNIFLVIIIAIILPTKNKTKKKQDCPLVIWKKKTKLQCSTPLLTILFIIFDFHFNRKINIQDERRKKKNVVCYLTGQGKFSSNVKAKCLRKREGEREREKTLTQKNFEPGTKKSNHLQYGCAGSIYKNAR